MTPSESEFTESLRAAADDAVAPQGLTALQVERTGGGQHRVVRVALARIVQEEQLTTHTCDPLPGLTLDEVAAVTPQVAQALEAIEPTVWATHALDVTTVGVSTPLVSAQDYRRNVGRLAQCVLVEGGTVEGRIVDVTHSSVSLRTSSGELRQLDLAALDHAEVQVEFSRPSDQE